MCEGEEVPYPVLYLKGFGFVFKYIFCFLSLSDLLRELQFAGGARLVGLGSRTGFTAPRHRDLWATLCCPLVAARVLSQDTEMDAFSFQVSRVA